MSRRPRSILMSWDGDHFVPNKAFAAYCNREFVVGEVYPMQIVEERSMNSHNHYFASLAEAFNNLSEENAKHFPSSQALRAWALVQCGYCTETNYVLKDDREARRLAADIRRRSEYSVIKVQGNVVQVFDPESQSVAAMKRERFQQSKEDVLSLVASMARTTPSHLNREAKKYGR